tara:strand:- start:6563 stop:6847 length:285 start_codon:yes stop_codon:yes gene_type:complete
MSWNELDAATINDAEAKRQAQNKRAEAVELAKAYNRCFNSDDGKKVFAHLNQRFVYNNDTPLNAPNVNYESAYHNGEAGVVKFILNQINQARIL